MQQIGDKQETWGRQNVGDRRLSVGRRQAEGRQAGNRRNRQQIGER